MQPFLDQKLNWLFLQVDSGLHVGLHVPKGSTSKPKASENKTAKAASNEGASKTTRRRRGSPPGSKNKPRIGHTVMQKAEAQAKANA
eukprot:364426-Chlamydomonas_euryale.AAC.49